jgi:hypothetical protein
LFCFYSGASVLPAAQGAVFVIAAKLGRVALLSACAAGGYFFRFAGKSNQKGATSLEEAIFFLYGNCRAVIEYVPFPATYCGGNVRMPALRRTQGRSLSRRCPLW